MTPLCAPSPNTSHTEEQEVTLSVVWTSAHWVYDFPARCYPPPPPPSCYHEIIWMFVELSFVPSVGEWGPFHLWPLHWTFCCHYRWNVTTWWLKMFNYLAPKNCSGFKRAHHFTLLSRALNFPPPVRPVDLLSNQASGIWFIAIQHYSWFICRM